MTVARGQFMKAMLDLTFERGYEAVSVEEIATAAGASREDFDIVFASKADCAMAVLEELANDQMRTVRAAYDAGGEWPDSLRAGAYAVAGWLQENPKKVRFGMVEMLWAGELTSAWRDSFFQNYLDMFEAGKAVAKDPDSIPEFTAEGIIGSITGMLARRLQQSSGIGDPQQFIPELMYLAVRPYLGEEAARRELTMPPPGSTAGDEAS
jgi:AcrR family transcriptional regulator